MDYVNQRGSGSSFKWRKRAWISSAVALWALAMYLPPQVFGDSDDADAQSIQIAFNPYEGVDWSDVEMYKMEVHAHTRWKYSEAAELIRLFTGDAEDLEGELLSKDDAYDIPAVSYGTGPTCRYWPWEHLSSHDCWEEDFNPSEEGVVGFPVVEIDDVWHVNALFSTALPNDANDDLPEYDDWEEAIDILIRNREWTVVDTDPEATPLLMLAHPSRYYDDPADDGVEAYRGPFERYGLADGLVGIEALNKTWDPWQTHMQQENSQRYDEVLLAGLLTDLDRRSGPCLIFGADDPNHYIIGHDIDRRWTEVLLHPGEFDPNDQSGSRRFIYEAIKAGRILASQREPWDHPEQSPHAVPSIKSVEVDEQEQTITVKAEGGEVYWINAREATSGEPEAYIASALEKGSTLNYGEHADILAGSHIIAHVIGPDRKGETVLQPFTFE